MKLAAVLLLVACGDNLPDPGTPRSGSRLKLGWYVYPGGARELETDWYYDTQLRMRCAPQLWSDGQRYCSPPTDEAVYVSDTCTRALGRTFKNLPPAPYFATTFKLAGESVPVRSRLFERGPATLAPIGIWQKGVDGCIPVALDEDYDYFELGAEIPVPDLVHLQRSEPQGSGALAVVDEVGEDGLRVPIALYARDAESECKTVDRPNAASTECVPESAPVAAYYHDDTCTEPEVASTSAPARAVRFETATSCWRYYDVTQEVSAPPLYEETGGGCMQTSPPAGKRFFTVGAMRPLPSLERVRTGSARIREIVRTTTDVTVRDPYLYDAELDTDCQRDANLACAPRTEAALQPPLSYFADPTCTQELRLAFVPSGACDPPTRYATWLDGYYPLAAPYTAPIYVPSTGDTCSGFSPPPPYVAWTVGEPLDASTFVRAELVIDP